ncbi:hypothetical protein Y032_0101g3396 [Ancylostoma ceylanicum]|uniref:Uncharacterized protein n=1 Tax=Ancylostoma ceylanicum TaxID=53326 RepID=A0A016THX0_9BILA|nr:hypothetical protein Y032_0101g3396 [Ancylostoma ceylanicum]
MFKKANGLTLRVRVVSVRRPRANNFETDCAFWNSAVAQFPEYCMFSVSYQLSVSSGLSSAVFLLSRLNSNDLAFVMLSMAFALHAFSPFIRWVFARY